MFLPFILFLLGTLPSFAQLTNESELGIASANGNTRTQTYSAKQLNDYKWTNNVLGFRSRYLHAKANEEETARFFMAGLRYENQVSTRSGLFVGETFEKDRFAGIHNRYISDLGGKYRFFDTERTKLFSELGYRYMHEARIDDTKAFSQYARLFSEWEHKWNLNFLTRYWVEFLPNISRHNDWQLNSELSMSAVLSKTFSLKTGLLLRYDHLPAPGILYKTDTLFTTALVAKF